MQIQARFILSITLPDCLALLLKVGERWREAALCAEPLRPVVDEVVRAFQDRVLGDLDMDLGLGAREAVTTEKVRQLLFPDGPLAWDARVSDASPAGSNGTVHQDADEFGTLPDFQDSGWDGEWDLADLLYGSMNSTTGMD